MATESNIPISVDIGIQTEDVFHDGFLFSASSAARKLTPDDSPDVSDYGSSYKSKSLFASNDDDGISSSNCETDLESNAPYSSCSSCMNTRRNSIISDSDLEIPMHLLFGSTTTPSATSTTSNSQSPHAISSSSSYTSSILEGVDVLLRRSICERFLELRRIQLGERAVSGGHARQNLETFFYRAIHGPTEEERMQQESQNRPIHVVNDVNHLQQQSLVQSALQNGFRGQLERTLQSRIPTTVTRPTSVQTAVSTHSAHVGGSQFRSQLEALLSDRTSQIQSQTRRVQNNSASRSQPSIYPTGVSRPPPPPPPLVEQSNNVGHHQQTANLQSTLQAGMQLLTDSITEDLTRLQSLQVVSNMLRTDFRNELEQMVQERVENVGNGETVENFIRSLPRPSNSPGRVHQQTHHLQADQNVSSELHSLRQQLDEMKRMMAMSMEVQMDTQRAIRQEVAAIFTTFMQDYLVPQCRVSNPTAFYPRRSTPVTSGQCVICIDRNIDTVLYQCGHMCVCNACGLQLKMDGHNCPMCRAPIRDVIRAYQTQ